MFEGLMVVEEDDNGVYNLELKCYLKFLGKITILSISYNSLQSFY